MDTEHEFQDDKTREPSFDLEKPEFSADSKAAGIDKTVELTKAETEPEYIKGVKLALVITAVTLVAFLMMLDMSIIVTVCSACWRQLMIRQFPQLPVTSTPYPMLDGMAVSICWPGNMSQSHARLTIQLRDTTYNREAVHSIQLQGAYSDHENQLMV
jgi:hypothetical protein